MRHWKKNLPTGNALIVIGCTSAWQSSPVTRRRARGCPSRDSGPLRKGHCQQQTTLFFFDDFLAVWIVHSYSPCSLRRLLSSRCDGVCVISIPSNRKCTLVLTVHFVAVASQQPYAMQWSVASAASPAAVALGKNIQKRSVGWYGVFYGFLGSCGHVAISTSCDTTPDCVHGPR